jgi:hypothetical protein
MRKSYFWVIAVVIVLALGVTFGYQYGTAREVTITVTDKERIVEKGEDGGSYYLVFTEDDAYKNEDALFYGKFKSSSLQAKLKVGETYNVKIYGWRVGFLSMYPNIVKIVE